MRRCNCCGGERDDSEFYYNAIQKYFKPDCKVCHRLLRYMVTRGYSDTLASARTLLQDNSEEFRTEVIKARKNEKTKNNRYETTDEVVERIIDFTKLTPNKFLLSR
jgi:hypothetical protein